MRYSGSLVSTIIAGTWILCFTSGCAKVPEEELNAAKTADKSCSRC